MLNMICALQCEGNPIIKTLNLKKIEENPFPLFKNGDLQLLICGIGGVKAACGCGYLAGKSSRNPLAFLNIGVAGHPDYPLGQAALIGKVTCKESGKTFYPTKTFASPLPFEPLTTVAQPCFEYTSSTFIDMEGASIFEAASRFCSPEWIHLIKIVSDNRHTPFGEKDPRKVEALIEGNLPTILASIEALQAQLEGEKEHSAPPEAFAPLFSLARYTKTEERQLYHLLASREGLPLPKLTPRHFQGVRGKRVLALLEEEIEGVAPCLGEKHVD